MTMRANNSRGIAAVYLLVAGALIVAGALGGTLKLPAFLQHQPPTAQLAATEGQLAQARAAQAQAEAQLAAARAEQQARTLDQGRYAQGAIAGAAAALATAPDSPEVKLASELVRRADGALGAAFNQLPSVQRAEWQKLVSDALAAKGREVEALKQELAQKDNQLAAATSAKDELAAKIPQLESAVVVKSAETQVVSAKADTLTQQVSAYAQAKAEADKRAGSFEAYASWLVRTCIVAAILLAALYLLVHFVLPSLAQEPGAAGWLVTLNKYTRSISSAH